MGAGSPSADVALARPVALNVPSQPAALPLGLSAVVGISCDMVYLGSDHECMGAATGVNTWILGLGFSSKIWLKYKKNRHVHGSHVLLLLVIHHLPI